MGSRYAIVTINGQRLNTHVRFMIHYTFVKWNVFDINEKNIYLHILLLLALNSWTIITAAQVKI